MAQLKFTTLVAAVDLEEAEEALVKAAKVVVAKVLLVIQTRVKPILEAVAAVHVMVLVLAEVVLLY
jgi:hypothetical protein